MRNKRLGVLDPKGREDHFVPQGYLRGFIRPDLDQKVGRLEVFELSNYYWGGPRSTDKLCTEIGFYDYSVAVAPETADDSFEELESRIPEVRKKVRANAFRDWTRHRDFLVRFAHMLVVRSKLFRDGIIAASQRKIWLRALEVTGNTIKYEPVDPSEGPDAEARAKNLAITEMRVAIRNLADEWKRWRWSLCTAPHERYPFVTSDSPVVMDGPGPGGMQAYSSGRFRVVVPFGWDFALVGSTELTPPEGPRELSIPEMDELRIVTASGATEVLISPIRLPDMKWFGRVNPAVPLMPR